MTIREFIELLKKYPKYYKLIDSSPEGGIIQIRDEKGKFVDSIDLEKIFKGREQE